MVGRMDTGTALSAGAVDAQFWALVCEDEEWLDAEFAGIVSEPAESRVRAYRRLGLLVDRPRSSGRRRPDDARVRWRRPDPVAWRPPGGLRRQRSPPAVSGRGFVASNEGRSMRSQADEGICV
jgi:hypothetical protein